MTEREALLRAICENPDDDTPRLVFADWLDEHGEPERAEFIRVQIELAGLPDGKKKQKQQAREKELLDAHKQEWTEPLKEFRASRTEHPARNEDFCIFRRGFVEGISSDGAILVEQGERLFTLAPIRELRLWDVEPDEHEALAKCKWLLRLHTLNLAEAGLGEEFGTALIRSRYLANLTALCMPASSEVAMDSTYLRALAGTKHLANLTRLDISEHCLFMTDPYFGDDEEQAAACKRVLPRLGEKMPALRELRLSSTGVHDDDVRRLVGQAWVSRLRVLDLSRNCITETGCRSLCESKNLANLERLDLTGNMSDDEDTSVPLSESAKRMLEERFGKRVVV
jgi:uncharacterized protein (TIGR02996 family)